MKHTVRNCKRCDKIFNIKSTHPKQKFCSISCSKKAFGLNKEKKLIQNYISGKSLTELSNKYHIGIETCRQILIRNNVARRGFDSMRKYSVDHNCFDEIDNSDAAYWVGFLMADGNISSTENCVSLEIKDKEHLEKFKLFMSSDSPICGPRKKCYRIRVYSENIKKSLAKVDIVPKKTFCAKTPNIPIKLERDFWRGCLDGDGSIGKRKSGFWDISLCGTFDIVNGFSKFISKSVGVDYKVPSKTSSIFSISYGGRPLPKKILRVLYENASVCLDRKKCLADELIFQS